MDHIRQAYIDGMKIKMAKLLHGKAKKEDVKPKDVDPTELAEGKKVEKEHTGKSEVSKTIAMDHLTEIPDYYTRLKKMETAAKSAQHTAKDQASPGESRQDIESKNKDVKAVMKSDKAQPRGKGDKEPEGEDAANPGFGETYKDISTKQAYEIGFAERCAAHGLSVEQLAGIVEKLGCENAMAAPQSVAFVESDIPVTTDKEKIEQENEQKEEGDKKTVRRTSNAMKSEVQPDILKSRVSGGGTARSTSEG